MQIYKPDPPLLHQSCSPPGLGIMDVLPLALACPL